LAATVTQNGNAASPARLEFGFRRSERLAFIECFANPKNFHRSNSYEKGSKDHDSTSATTEWKAGHHDAFRILHHPEIFETPSSGGGVQTFDFVRGTSDRDHHP
jgi:hypothetical protein